MPHSPARPDRPDVVPGAIAVRGARENNLRDLDLDIPRDTLVAFTGISGSGKSSLAFGTVFAQANQRYLESVSPYARRLLNQGSAPQVRLITGLPPAVALRQHHGGGSSRSSVGTVSRISNVLRMLYSRAGSYPPGYRPADLAGSFPRDAAPLDSDSFSPNTAVGACRTCTGLGHQLLVDESRLVGDPQLSIREGAIAAWPGAFGGQNYRRILEGLGVDIDIPFADLPEQTQRWVLTTDEQPTLLVNTSTVEGSYRGTYLSPKRWVEHTFADTKSARMRALAASFMTEQLCPSCHGLRLNPEALAVTIAGQNIAQATALTLTRLREFLRGVPGHPDTADLEVERRQAATALLEVLDDQLGILIDLGLGYLSTARPTSTLSGGELQRLHLATQLRSGLFGVLYVLDEPSAGLHPADTELLLGALHRLQAEGNSVLLVEHNPVLIQAAPWVIDLGPGAGSYGGQVLYNGPAAGLVKVAESATARYLRADAPAAPSPAQPRAGEGAIELTGVRVHNLDLASVRVPLHCLTAVTGVSGAGKTTLLRTLAHQVRQAQDPDLATELARDPEAAEVAAEREDQVPIWDLGDSPIVVAGASGLGLVDRLVVVDQKPIGRTNRSNLATYTGLFDAVRKLFAAQPEAKRLGFGAGRFSFNLPAGRCPHCLGEGVVSIELLFMPTQTAPCPVCHGARYNPETLQVTVQGRTIAEVLAMSVDQAREFLAELPVAARILGLLTDIGLGYLGLGQSAPTLSGGEAQRIKLVSELHRAPAGHGLYLLDEPTNGLHPADIDLLVAQLQRLVEAGNTVVIADHDPRTIAACDWVIDLGPGGGDQGGRLVAQGVPEQLAATPGSQTGRHLPLN